MKMLRRTRLAIAVLALGGLGLGPAAQADPFVGRLIGSVAAGMLVNGAIKKHDKKFAAQCRLYDREGMEVYLPCDSRRPLGEVMLEQRPDAMAENLAGGPPPPVDVAPLAAPAAPHHGRAYADAAPVHAPPVVHYAPPPVRYAPPVEDHCDCRPEAYAARPVTSFLSAQGGHSQTYYGAGRVVGVYDAYDDFSTSGAVRYSENYGYADGGHGGAYSYGFTGGSSGYSPYGAAGYGAGGYADRARVAGRDRDGFLTWAGKPVR